jgi:hypothetical protein
MYTVLPLFADLLSLCRPALQKNRSFGGDGVDTISFPLSSPLVKSLSLVSDLVVLVVTVGKIVETMARMKDTPDGEDKGTEAHPKSPRN